ncbi:hypothetical protein GQ53DRAFT_77533 [Thozetella sp. PMI_491]|nr:hypothetical protein GQ53DRAFT_77533 [Thozetella sp. PMI_491]
MAAPPNKPPGPLDQLQLMFNDVLVQTGKALKAAHRDGKSNTAQANLSVLTKIPQSIEIFNCALDDMESEIIRSKSTILRDIQQAQARKNPPPPQPTLTERNPQLPESKPVAPPAPMVIDLDPPPKVTPVPPPVVPPQALTAAQRVVKQEPKPPAPVAPFPNMGFDLTGSPEVVSTPTPIPVPTPPATKVPTPTPAKMPTPTPAKMPTPTPAKMPTPTPAKMPTPTPAKAPTPVMKNKPTPTNPPRPGASPVATRPASTPPKKETKVPVPQVPRSAAATPQIPPTTTATPPAPAAPRAVSLPTAVTSPPSQVTPIPAPESLFTNSSFTLAPPLDEHQLQSQPSHVAQSNQQSQPATQTQSQPPAPNPVPDAIDLTDDAEMGGLTLESFGLSSVPGAEIANMSLNLSAEDSVDAKIDGLFDLASSTDNMDLDYDLGAVGDNSNFDDLFFGTQDDNIDSGEFTDPYFQI